MSGITNPSDYQAGYEAGYEAGVLDAVRNMEARREVGGRYWYINLDDGQMHIRGHKEGPVCESLLEALRPLMNRNITSLLKHRADDTISEHIGICEYCQEHLTTSKPCEGLKMSTHTRGDIEPAGGVQ